MNDMYVGYQPRMDRGLARFLLPWIGLIVALAVTVAATIANCQTRLPKSTFEYGVRQTLTGTVLEQPYPMLLVDRPGVSKGEASRYYLTSFGKHGAQSEVRGLDGVEVSLTGSLIFRDNQTMLEIVKGSIQPHGDSGFVQTRIDLGEVSLVGEIVDSKCFLGVMNPGNLKPHKSCAINCIAGGIPPVLLVRGGPGQSFYALLTDADGAAINRRVLQFVAEPVRVRGQLIRSGDLFELRAHPDAIQPLKF